MILWTCDHCGNSAWIEDSDPIRCGCGGAGNEIQPAKLDRERIRQCNACEFRQPWGCQHYARPCSLRKYWAGRIPAPEACPHRDREGDSDS